MQRVLVLACFATLITGGVMAQEAPESERGRDRRGAGRGIISLVQFADADASGEVSAQEWVAFVDSLGADASGKLDPQTVAHKLTVQVLDANRDGELTSSDLTGLFSMLDTEQKGVVQLGQDRRVRGSDGPGTPDEDSDRAGGREAPRSGNPAVRRIGLALLSAADVDADRSVTRAEWDALVSKLPTGNLSVVELMEALGPDGAALGRTLRMMFGPVGSAGFDLDTLQAAFKRLDRNEDGALQADELSLRGRRPGGASEPRETPKKKEEKGEVY